MIRLFGGLNALLPVPCGCAEGRIALAFAELAMLPSAAILDAAGLRDRIAADVAAAAAAVRLAADDDGLVAFWPRTRGSVWLTATAYRFLVAADRAGQPVDKPAIERMGKVLTAALRSDYPRLLSGEEMRERVAALTALADGGVPSAEYAGELARRASTLPTESLAQVAGVLARLPQGNQRLLAGVLETLWNRVNLLNRDGQPVYAGLADSGGSAFVLPSETRTLADMLRTVAVAAPDDRRVGVLRTGLLGLGTGQGWGTSNATAAALGALGASWPAPPRPIPASTTLGDRTVTGTLDRDRPLLVARGNRPGPARVQARPGVAVLVGTDFVPAELGAAARAVQNGFVLTRTLYRVTGAGPMTRLDPEPDGSIRLTVGDVVEEVAELATPEERTHASLRLPLPAGLEPLSPNLATAPAEAAASVGPTVPPSWSAFADDEVRHVWLTLPRGTVTVRHRLRAAVPGNFTHPPALAEMLYLPGVDGSSAGQRVVVSR